MSPEQEIQQLEETKAEVLRFTNELDEKLANQQIDQIAYHATLHDKFMGKTKEELLDYIDRHISIEKNKLAEPPAQNASRKLSFNTATISAVLLVLIAIIGIIYLNPNTLTGLTVGTREITQTTPLDRAFDHYTEAQLEFNRITSLKISGSLEGTRALVKLRVNGTDYLVAEIIKPEADQITGLAIGQEATLYTLATDKSAYALGETAIITLTPETLNQSLYIGSGGEMQKLETNAYTPQNLGEYQVVALVVIESDIIRLETNFTVTDETSPAEATNRTENESNQATTTIMPETEAFAFTGLCAETCSLPETDNPILIVELDGNSTLNITTIMTTQNKDNEAPVQTNNIPDITLPIVQAAELDLNNYFTDPDGDVVQYDINEIPEISSAITQNLLTLSGTTPGVYTAYIYATDGDQLSTSNTFQIIIQEETGLTTNETVPETNTTTNETGVVPPTTTDLCSNPDINQRPSSCFVGIEENLFESLTAQLQDNNRETKGLFTRFGNLIITGLLIQDATSEPSSGDFQLGYTQPEGFGERRVHTAWIDSETGNLYLKGQIFENQESLDPQQFNTFIIRNKFGMILGYFDELKGDLYLRGNIVQLGRI